MSKKAKTANFGSVTTHTMRPEDLIPAFADELDYLRNGTNRKHQKLTTAARNLKIDAEGYYKDEDGAREVLSELFGALNGYAPDYGYFGASPYDGADYGFWLPEFFEQEFEGAKISDLSELAELDTTMVSEALYVNDHGNMTLYAAWTRGKKTTWKDVWAVV